MARLLGFIGNRTELGPRILLAHAEQLKTVRVPEQPLGWGLGFYQGGEVLLRRRPLDERSEIDLAKAAESLKTEALIGHVRSPTVGNLRTENTHPFKYREWLFAQTGTLQGFEGFRQRLLEFQPEFLRPNVRGDTDSESFFYLFLSYLHGEGHLDARSTAPENILAALRATVLRVDALCDEAGVPTLQGDILLTNGEQMLALHRSGKMARLLVNDAQEVGEYLADSGKAPGLTKLAEASCCVLASEMPELPESWIRVPANSLLSCGRTSAPSVEPL